MVAKTKDMNHINISHTEAMSKPYEPQAGSRLETIQLSPESDKILRSVSGKTNKDAFINECIRLTNKKQTHGK